MRFLIGIFLLIGLCANAQDFTKLDTTIKKYEQYFQPEKIHVHFDRTIVKPQEPLRFKIYLLQSNLPSQLSATVYVDFFTDSGKLLAHTIWPVLESTAKGSFDLPENISTKEVQVVAYTAWMKNFDSSFWYRHQLPVLQQRLFTKSIDVKPITTIRFLPEGGELVAGVPNNIAFNASNQDGLPVAIKGYVLNKAGDTSAVFETIHQGRGKFALWPEPDQEYTAFWKDAYGKSYTTTLPAAKKLPASLQVSRSDKGVRFVLQSPVSISKQKIYVLAYLHQQLVFRAGYALASEALKVGEIETTGFPSGLLQITVFNEQWQPIAERVAFVHGLDQEMQVDIAVDKKNLQPRAKNGFTVFVPDTLKGSLSISVTDELEPADSNYGIMSQLLLKSDLRGYIHQADWYFRDNYLEKQDALDLVMLTNGWRKYDWEAIASGKLPAIIVAPEIEFIQLNGQISGFTPGTIRDGETINLFIQGKDSSKQFFSLPISTTGAFGLSNMLFTDTATVYYNFNKNSKLNNSLVGIHNGFQSAVRSERPLLQQIQNADSNLMVLLQRRVRQQQIADSLGKTATLQEVVVQAKAKTKLQEINDVYVQNGMFNNPGSEQLFDVMSDSRAAGTSNIFNYLKGMVAGLIIKEDMLNGAEVTWRGDKTELYLNEIRVDARTLQTVAMADIAVVKTFRPPFMGAYMGGSGGAIAVYTKNGNKAERSAANGTTGLARSLFGGYSVYKEFFSPDYSINSNFSKKDFRSTLYWDPMVLADKFNRQFSVYFYHNDIGKKYRIIIEGMNEAGKIVHVEKIVE